MGVVGAVLSVVGAGIGLFGQMSQASAQRDASRAQARLASLKAARERTQQIREARIKRAQVEQTAANAGAAASSGAISGAQTIESAAASNIAYINQEEGFQQAFDHFRRRELNAEGIAQLGSSVMGIGSTIFNNKDEIGDIFGKSK